MRAGLLEHGREHVADIRLLPSGALHVQDGGLEHAPEGQGLAGLAVHGLRQALDLVVQVAAQAGAQALEIDAAGAQDLLARGMMGDGEEQVLEGQVRVAAGDGLPHGHVENHLESCAEHRDLLGPLPL
jgi:hypothetical protein